MAETIGSSSRAICDYEGTSYRANFWDGHGREYEDLAERIALKRLLPSSGHRLLDVGAGFGRIADLYGGFEQVVLLDYARSGLEEARARLGHDPRFLFVVADIYHLPLAAAAFNTIVSVRVLHHLVDVPAALRGLAELLARGGSYVLEYANKRNLKSIMRYALRRQSWSPFAQDPVEFTALNFDFHPRWMSTQLNRAGFRIESGLAVSHFRQPLLKRVVPPRRLAQLDGAIQKPSAAWKLSPSVFLRAVRPTGEAWRQEPLFRCPSCLQARLEPEPGLLRCTGCGAGYSSEGGIYDFKTPLP